MAVKFTKLSLTETEKKYLIKLLTSVVSTETNSTRAKAILGKMGVEPKPDLVKGMKCGKIAMYPRAELVEYYQEAVACCDGCERLEYMDIVEALLDGATDVSNM